MVHLVLSKCLIVYFYSEAINLCQVDDELSIGWRSYLYVLIKYCEFVSFI